MPKSMVIAVDRSIFQHCVGWESAVPYKRRANGSVYLFL